MCLLVLDRACKCARVHALGEQVVVLRLCASSSKGRSVQFCVLNQYEPMCVHAYVCEAALHDQDLAKRYSELHVYVCMHAYAYILIVCKNHSLLLQKTAFYE